MGVSIHNLLEADYADPGSPDLLDAGIRNVPGEGRQLRAYFEWQLQ
jgi:hypothetical protein